MLASHTHFAPGIDPGVPTLGATDPAYVELVVERVAEAIGSLGSGAVAAVSWASVPAPGLLVNRRRPVLGRVVSAPHRRGPVDDVLRLVRVSVDREPVALLWGLSCHPVCSPNPTAVSACFPGAVRDELRGTLGRDLPVLFAQGFSAEVRPDSTTRRPPRAWGALPAYVAAGGQRFGAQDEETYRRWCRRLTELAVRAGSIATAAEGAPVLGRVSRVAGERSPGWTRTPVLSRLEVATGLSLVTVNAEVPSERVVDLGDLDGLVVPAGCCDEVIGYWPTDAMRREGGYEGGGAARHFPPLDWSAVGGPDALWARLLADLADAGRR